MPKIDFNAGITGFEVDEAVGKPVVRNRLARGKGELSCPEFHKVIHPPQGEFDRPENALRFGKKDIAGCRQLHMPAAAVKQRDAQILLKCRDRTADR